MNSTLKNRLVRHLARRDHSRRELHHKLKPHAESSEELEQALQWADDLGLLKSPEVLSQSFSRYYHQRLKAHRQIQTQMQAKGLPPPIKDSELELKKALELAKKWGAEDKQKLARRLGYRGFDAETIRRVLLNAKKTELP